MFSCQFDRVPIGLAQDYSWKMKHNFKQYIYLSLKSGRWEDKLILPEIWSMEGYICHRVIMYSDLCSHIYVKFENNNLARNAVDYFRNLDGNLNAEIADTMLCSWYIFEYTHGYLEQGTAAHVNLVGTAPHCTNLMVEPIVASILKEFGEPQVLALREAAAHVVFDSMAEALAACIAHGNWEKNELSYCQLYFRVRIIGVDKEADLISRSMSQDNIDPAPLEAFKLEYFIDPVEAGWGTVEHHRDSNFSASTSTDTTHQYRGRRIRSRSDIFTNQTLTENSLGSHILGFPSSVYPTRSLTETVLYNDYGMPLGIMVNNNYDLVFPPGNTQYTRTMQEARLNHNDVPPKITTLRHEDCTETFNDKRSPTFLSKRSFSENSFLNRERNDSELDSNSATGFSSGSFQSENLWLSRSALNNSNVETFTKNVLPKPCSKNFNLLPTPRDSSKSTAKPRDNESSPRKEHYRSLEFRSSRFKNNSLQMKNYWKK